MRNLSRIFALAMFILAGSAFAAVVENDKLRVELDETNGSLTVVDKRTSPLYFFNEETWKRFRGQLKASYDVATPVAKATYSSPMKAYRILTPDRSVQRVEFENGVASTVNFGGRPFKMKDGRVLPPHGSLFDSISTETVPRQCVVPLCRSSNGNTKED